MRFSNLHTHTTFSDGKGTVRENIESAIAKNMLSIGFSDHSFTACDTSYCMKLADYDRYCAEVKALKAEYQDQISVFLGIEKDYYSEIEKGMFEYVLASVHYIVKNGICYPIDHSPEQQLHCIQNAFDGDIFAMAQCYFDLLCEHVEHVKPTVVGHFDVLTKFSLMPEDDERYRESARKALKRIIRTCPYIEVNTGAIARGWRKTPYPGHYLLETVLEEGGEVVLGSDSHHKDNLIFYFNETVELLKSVGFDHVCMFNGSGFDMISI
jgi:histidinol-phosphatase (PHP family)